MEGWWVKAKYKKENENYARDSSYSSSSDDNEFKVASGKGYTYFPVSRSKTKALHNAIMPTYALGK